MEKAILGKNLKKLCNNSLSFISPLRFSQVSEKSQLNTVEGRVVIQGFLTRRAVPDVEGRLECIQYKIVAIVEAFRVPSKEATFLFWTVISHNQRRVYAVYSSQNKTV